MESMLHARSVTKRFRDAAGDHCVLHEVDLRVCPGEWIAIMGRSGSGKSTLLHLLGGLDTPTTGTVEVAGITVSTLRQSARARVRRRHIGFVFQQYNLVDDLSASGNVELALALSGVARRHRRPRARRALADLGLAHRATAAPAQLSGGEQQRVALARALASQPDVVLADEPTGALDSDAAGSVIDVFRRLRDDGRTIVMVTHDIEVAAVADRIVRLVDGTVEPTLLAPAYAGAR